VESLYTKYGINKNTYKLLFEEKEEGKCECSKEIIMIEQSSIYDMIIKKYPLFLPFIWWLKILDSCFRYPNIRRNILKRGYSYINKDISFEFDYLKKYFNKILENEDPYVRKQMFRELKYERYGKCYNSSMIISANIENSYCVTSLISFEDGSSHLHSYVEYNGYVIDYTKNLIIKKEVYDKLLQTKEISKIKSEDITYIFNLLVDNGILNANKFMTTFGEEIKKDLEKNKSLIKIPESDKRNFGIMFW